MSEERIILENARVLDVVNGRALPGHRVIIRGRFIDRVESARGGMAPTSDDRVIDVGGMTVMPGLCDAHVHATAWTANLSMQMRSSPTYTAARAAEILEGMLLRGFTTVRDGGGADFGLAAAVDAGYFRGPRILYCGHALSQTGGHGDFRTMGEQTVAGLNTAGAVSLLCDGVTELRRACRDEARRGAHHIKLMLSGGVVSPTDRIGNTQFSENEVRAAVEEAEMAGLYCMGHVYESRAINRALNWGVRSMEHCNLMDESSLELFLKHDAFMVPTLSTYDSLAREGVEAGLPPELLPKLASVLDQGKNALAMAYHAGIRLVYGTDLLGSSHKNQLNEFALRGEIQAPADVIRSATSTAAELFNEVGETGVVAAGARADLLVVDGDPLEDLGVLQRPEWNLKAIMKGGTFYKNAITS